MKKYDLSLKEDLEELVRRLLNCLPTQFEQLPATYIDQAIEYFRDEQPDAEDPSNYIFSTAVEYILADANVRLDTLQSLYKADGAKNLLTPEQDAAFNKAQQGDGFFKVISWYANGNYDSSVSTTAYAVSAEGIHFLEAVDRLGKEYGRDVLGWVKENLDIDLKGLLPEPVLPDEHLKPFEYGGYHFQPEPKFCHAAEDFGALPKRLGAAMLIPGGYNYSKFYEAYGHQDCDVFRCLESGKLYIPCGGNLIRFLEDPA